MAVFLRATLLLCLLLSMATRVAGQTPAQRKAGRLYQQGLEHKARHRHAQAEASMRAALVADPGLVEAYGTLGAWLLNDQQYAAAAAVYEKAAQLRPAVFLRPWLRSLVYSGQADRALPLIPTAPDSLWATLRQQAQLQRSLRLSADTARAYPIGPPERVNSADAELFPSLSTDGQTLYFTRRVGGMDEDFFYARPDTCGGWLTARNMGAPPNSKQQEAAQMISADGHYLFYMRCDNRSESGWDKGGCDLYMAYTADTVWSVAQSFGGTINSPGYEGMPCLSADNRELFFVSDRPGGYGGLDIWVSTFDQGLWQLPRNLGPRINTPGDETAPFLHADGQTLYFSSTGLPGLGGSDLFVARREIADTVWTVPRHLGLPFNTPYDDASLTVTPDGRTALFASNRERSSANFDLFTAAVPASFQPLPVTFVKGRTYDSLNGEPLTYGRIYIADSNGNDLYQVVTNRGDGSFMLALPTGNRFSCYVTRIGYSEISDTIICDAPTDKEAARKAFAMLPFGYQKPTTDTIIARLPFRKNAVALSDSLGQVLDSSISSWHHRPGKIAVIVNGYTDDSGTPIINEQLSAARARAVADRIRSLGFPAEAVTQQAWGEANALVPNDSDENRDINRRVEVVIRW